jgi:hypothetical protein
MTDMQSTGSQVCEKCGASFETAEELDKHMRETHMDMGEKPMGGEEPMSG